MDTKNTLKSSNSNSTGATFHSASSGSKTMAELLANYKPRVLFRGEEVQAKVLRIKGNVVILDLGTKAEGVIEGREYENAKDFIKSLKVGQTITAVVVNPEMDTGTVSISLKRAGEVAGWERLARAQEIREPVLATGKKLTRGGISAEVFGVQAFVPTSQLSAQAAANTAALLERQFEALVIEIDRSKQRVVLSERAVTEKEKIAEAQKIVSHIKRGEKLEGEVTALVNSGAFVRIKKEGIEFDGFVHTSEFSFKESGEAVLQIGDTVSVVFLGQKEGKVSLSIKQAQTEVWDKIKERFAPETRVKGTIAKVAPDTLYITLGEGVTGIMQANKLPVGKTVQEGESIDCLVESIDDKRQRINLGLALTVKPMGYK